MQSGPTRFAPGPGMAGAGIIGAKLRPAVALANKGAQGRWAENSQKRQPILQATWGPLGPRVREDDKENRPNLAPMGAGMGTPTPVDGTIEILSKTLVSFSLVSPSFLSLRVAFSGFPSLSVVIALFSRVPAGSQAGACPT